MKLICSAAIFGLVRSEFDTIIQQLAIGIKANNVSVPNTGGPGERAFVDPILSMMQPIYGYGCWCWFNEDWNLAGGPVNDDIDLRCKQLINGYRCAKQDAKSLNEECDPGTVQYNAYNLFMGGNLMDYCEGNNVEICAQDACKIEGQFSLDYLSDFITGNIDNLKDASLQSSLQGGSFDRDTECVVNYVNVGAVDRECCGEQPYRAPFSASKGAHGCCGESLFSVNLQECCTDQTVASIGTCP